MDDLLKNLFKSILPPVNFIPTNTPGNLFIGSAVATRPDLVSSHRYGAVISLFEPDYVLPGDITHHYFKIDNKEHMTPDMQLLGHHVVPIIHHYLMDGHNVLIHCRSGMQRAPTLGVYYLMQEESLTEHEAIKKIVDSRWVAFRHGLYFTFF